MKRRPRHLENISYDLYSILDFGRYEGRYIKDVIEENPDWLRWALDEIIGFRLSQRAEEQLDMQD